MKVLTTAGLTKLIQLIKSSFISVEDVEQTTELTLAPVATAGTVTSLSDTVITSATNGQVLTYNGTNWVNGNANVATFYWDE